MRLWLVVGALLPAATAIAGGIPSGQYGVPPQGMNCPATQPIKGNFTPTDPDEYCIYHVPGGQFYARTRPERCYASEADAMRDGCRRSKR